MVFSNTKSFDRWAKGSILILNSMIIGMKYSYIASRGLLSAVLLAAIIITGCKKDSFLDVQNSSAVSGDVAFSTESSADLVLNDVYSSLPDFNNFVFEPFDSCIVNLRRILERNNIHPLTLSKEDL